MENEKTKKIEQESKKRKSDILQVITGLKQNHKRAQIDYEQLTKSADEYTEKAEATQNLTLITKSNSFKRTAGKKKALSKSAA